MSILEKLYLGTKKQVIEDIFDLYESQGFVFVNYLYFANLMHQRLLEKSINNTQRKYKKALGKADFLLADGIALQLFYRFGFGKKKKITPENLNGTDLFPELMKQVKKLQKSGKKIHMAWYGLYDPTINKSEDINYKAITFLKKEWGLTLNTFVQSLYEERGKSFSRKLYKKSLGDSNYDVRIFCNFIGTPFQEVWIEKNRSFFEENNILVLNQGGTIDFLSGFEKRAPKRIVKSRVLETPWRVITHPKKNLKKFFWMFGIVRYWISSLLGKT